MVDLQHIVKDMRLGQEGGVQRRQQLVLNNQRRL